MPKESAGLLPYRRRDGRWEFLLVHPGGPFWAKKDAGAWGIAKGGHEAGEDAFAAALREFEEETGFRPSGKFVPLGTQRQPSGKVIEAWAVETDWDPGQLRSNTCTIEWPKGAGRRLEIPEVDRAAWFPLEEALLRIRPGQRPFVEALHELLARPDLRKP
jgi:predicted NUDIX family NTP pyrophosphohydrolase